MRAIEVSAPGGVEALVYVDRPDPVAGAGEVVIDVAYAGANWGDIQKREGVYPDPIPYPSVIGLEVSGTIVSMGDGVTGLAQGQRVAAITGPSMLGGYAEKCIAGADYCIPLPDGISLQTGAAFPVTSLTAYHLLHSAYHVKAGDKILIHAIGGGVGLALTQLALAAGAIVIGTVSRPGKGDNAKAYGAQLIIDRSSEDFVDATRRFTGGAGLDLVIDSLGADILPRSIDLLKTYGHVINIGEAAGYPDFDIRPKLYENSTSLAGFEVLHAMRVPEAWARGIATVIGALQSGALEMPIEEVFPFDEVHALHRRFETRNVSGKLLLQVAGGT